MRWLVTAGTPGFAPGGTLPADFASQAVNAEVEVWAARPAAGDD